MNVTIVPITGSGDIPVTKIKRSLYGWYFSETGGANSIGVVMRSPSSIAPGASTAAAGGAGNVDIGAHYWAITFVTASGETVAGTVSNTVTIAASAKQVNLTGIPISSDARVISRKVYRTIAAGSQLKLVATIANNTATTYTDNTADVGLGATVVATDTTGPILWQDTILASGSVGEDYARPIALNNVAGTSLHIDITGSGTAEGGPRGIV